jgi:phage shock protein A
MRLFHRLQQTLSIQVGSLLDQVENQEAVVVATIGEVERGSSRVRVHRKGCERRIDDLERAIAQHESDARLWRDRARRLKEDREKALECLRRVRVAEALAATAREQVDKQRALLESLREDERAIEGQLGELRRRRAQLSSREARTDAQAGVADLGDINGVFDRWEARIEGREVVAESRTPGKDSFARKLSEEEEATALLADLDRLLAEEACHGG